MKARLPLAAIALAACLGLAAADALAIGLDNSAWQQDPNYLRAKQMIEDRDYASAIPLLEQVLSADPKNANAHNYLGYSYRKLGNQLEALTHYQHALDLDPAHRGANEYLGELYLELGRVEKAKERLKVLKSACIFGCDAYDDLKAAIADYKAKVAAD